MPRVPLLKRLERGANAERLRVARSSKFDYVKSRGIGRVNFAHVANVPKAIEQLVKTHGAPVKILDVGCGTGKFADELKKKFGDKVEVHALDVRRRKEWNSIKGVKFHVGHAENVAEKFPENHFALVISTYGGFAYTVNPLNALEQAKQITVPNGRVMVHVDKRTLKERGTSVREVAKKLGARVAHILPFHPFYSIQFVNKKSKG